MNIAIDISPLSSGHKVRGVGFYLLHLKNALVKYFSEHRYTFFTRKEEIPSDVDIVHYPYFDPFFITLPLTKGYKTVVTIHDLTPIVFSKHFPAGIKGRMKWEINKFLLRSIDAIITDSDSSTKDVIDYTTITKEKVHTIYLAAGEEFKQIPNPKSQIPNMRKKYKLPERFALYVGDVTWNKNLPHLIESAVKTQIPLVLVGKAITNENYDKTNPWNQDLIKVQELLRNNKNIYSLGFVSDEDLVVLYNMATVFIMPSFYEGFGLPILEAMACGSPVLTSKEGSLEEVAGDAPYYVNPYSVESIAHGLQTIFTNRQLQKTLTQKGLQQVKKFSWKKTAQETIDVYKKAMQK